MSAADPRARRCRPTTASRPVTFPADAEFPNAVIGDLTALDLSAIRDPDGVSLPECAGELGVGDPFSFPLQSAEAPADVELITVRVPKL